MITRNHIIAILESIENDNRSEKRQAVSEFLVQQEVSESDREKILQDLESYEQY